MRDNNTGLVITIILCFPDESFGPTAEKINN